MSVSGGEKANGRTRAKKSKPKGFHFIDYDLTAEEKSDLRATDALTEYPLDGLLELVENGFVVKIAGDNRGGGYRCHLMDDKVDGTGDTFCLSGRGSSPVNAWHALAYRHFTLAKEDWTRFIAQAEVDEDYG